MPALRGDIAIGGIQAPVDGNLGDTLTDLRGVLTGRLEFRPGPWIFYVDAMYADLGTDEQLPLNTTVDIDFKQTMVALGMGYKIGEWPLGDGGNVTLALDVVGGIQWTNLQLDISITGPFPSQSKASTDWVDPFIGGRLALNFLEDWKLGVAGAVGGFGIGSASQLVWNLDVGFDWSVNDWFSFLFGYRILDYDYVRGNGADRFEYDMTLHGPFVAFKFSF